MIEPARRMIVADTARFRGWVEASTKITSVYSTSVLMYLIVPRGLVRVKCEVGHTVVGCVWADDCAKIGVTPQGRQ